MSAQTFTIGQFDAGDSLVRKYHLPFSKFDGTTAPGVGDDDTAGYVAGSLWADTTNHKVYICKDNSTGAAVWAEIPGTGGGGSPLTTKGDIFTYSTMDARLPVGTNGYILIADSSQATGLIWNQFVATANGGTGADSSVATGVAHVTAGSWTFGQIVTADIASNAVTSAQVDTSIVITSGANAFAGNQSMGGFNLTNVADPVAQTDAVNFRSMLAQIHAMTAVYTQGGL